jgi:tetrahydromethanopterin:alpha-L-glutamate ligase
LKQRFAIVSDGFGWHTGQLRSALHSQGCEALFVPLQDCRFDLQGRGSGLVLPGFESELPDGVFVRGIPGGSFQQVTFRLDILHALREMGVPVYNDVRGIERSVDKAMTSFLLRRAGLASPPSWVCSSPEVARNRVERELAAGHELVSKPLFGSQGKGLIRIGEVRQLGDPEECAGVYYLQRFVETDGELFTDWRVFVIGGRAVAAMQRKSSGWITNIARGAQCFPALPGDAIGALAQRAVDTLGLAYAGVDIIRGLDGQYQIIEVNSIPAWRGLQSVTPGNVAHQLVQHFLDFCRNSQCWGVAG